MAASSASGFALPTANAVALFFFFDFAPLRFFFVDFVGKVDALGGTALAEAADGSSAARIAAHTQSRTRRGVAARDTWIWHSPRTQVVVEDG